MRTIIGQFVKQPTIHFELALAITSVDPDQMSPTNLYKETPASDVLLEKSFVLTFLLVENFVAACFLAFGLLPNDAVSLLFV